LLRSVVNKLFWLSLVAIVLGVASYLVPLIFSRNSTNDMLKGTLQHPAEDKDILQKLRPSTSLRYVESILGAPLTERDKWRSYETSSHTIGIVVSSDGKSVSSITIGPKPSQKSSKINNISLSGPWGNIEGTFGKVTFNDVHKAVPCNKVAHWN